MSQAAPSDVAFYYPGPVWRSSEAIKNLLLFFDGVALLVPGYIRDKPERVHPELAGPLLDRGLLHILEPEEYVDGAATERLAEGLAGVIATGALDRLAATPGDFHELSMSRLGFYGDEGLAQMLLEELEKRGLARGTEDGVSIPMHREVRVLILVLLSQILRARGRENGLDLQPTTDRKEVLGGLTQFLSAPQLPSEGAVVSSDLEVVGVDLASVPLDEILDYRAQHGEAHRRYARNVRQFVRTLSVLDQASRATAIADRLDELTEQAVQLRREARAAWGRPASFALAGAGAVWTAVTGDPTAALFGFLSGAVAARTEAVEGKVDAFSYLVSMPTSMYG